MRRSTSERVAKLLRTLGESNRLEMCRRLARQPLTITDLVNELGLAQPLVSHHIKRLRDIGLVEKLGPSVRSHYRLRTNTMEALSRELWLIGQRANAGSLGRPRRQNPKRM